jgi:hypothetical protein
MRPTKRRRDPAGIPIRTLLRGAVVVWGGPVEPLVALPNERAAIIGRHPIAFVIY